MAAVPELVGVVAGLDDEAVMGRRAHERPAGRAKGQVPQLVPHHQVQVQQLVGEATGLGRCLILRSGVTGSIVLK